MVEKRSYCGHEKVLTSRGLFASTWRRTVPPMSHPTIKLFEHCATLLEMEGSTWDLDDAIAELAAWMDLVRYKLTDDDMAVLGQIGGVLYREGLSRRAE